MLGLAAAEAAPLEKEEGDSAPPQGGLKGGGRRESQQLATIMAQRIQAKWRQCIARVTSSLIEAGWTGARARRLGSIDAHVRFLQWVWRGRRRLQAAGIRSRMALIVLLRLCRKRKRSRCAGGSNLATDSEFDAMRAFADQMLEWYSVYVQLLRRYSGQQTPTVVQNFCGEGGATEGVRRAGGACHGVDNKPMPAYGRRFGADTFTQGDGTSWSLIDALKRRRRFMGMMASPPCKFYSRARVRGEAREPPLIDIVRDLSRAMFEYWTIENVLGAKDHMAAHALTLTGFCFGLRVSRGRLFESSFPLRMDASVLERARALERRTCLGARRRWRVFDEFGRPELKACCGGNIFSLTGDFLTSRAGTLEQCCQAMGVDVGHMEYAPLAQAIPPAMAQFVFSQMCMRICADRYGVPAISFDEMRARPSWARQTMAMWLRGAGGPQPTLGQTLQPVGYAAPSGESPDKKEPSWARELVGVASVGQAADSGGHAAVRLPDKEAPPLPTTLIREAEVRELNYSAAGGYTQQWVSFELRGRLEPLGEMVTLWKKPSAQQLMGHNTFMEVTPAELSGALDDIEEALQGSTVGTRITVVTRQQMTPRLRRMGFQYLPCILGVGETDALEAHGLVALWAGRRAWAGRQSRLDHAAVRPFMDVRDQGEYEYSKESKMAAAWREMPWLPELWEDANLPPHIAEGMTRGFEVETEVAPGNFEIPQYPWPSGEALKECICETNRGLAVGSMEYVPDDEVQLVRQRLGVHPWTVAMKPKPRACWDLTATNETTRSVPFGLPSVWDAAKVVGPDSHFCKYDLRDGFWSCPIRPKSRNLLVMRHPATGRLVRPARLPFGWKLSPFLFCGLTEALAQELRRRLAGQGVHVFVFVDDVLCVGENKEAARRGGEALEQLLGEVGIEWAPHKQRGPSAASSFWGCC